MIFVSLQYTYLFFVPFSSDSPIGYILYHFHVKLYPLHVKKKVLKSARFSICPMVTAFNGSNIGIFFPKFIRSFFGNWVDPPKLEQYCSKFGIDLSKFFESYPKDKIDCYNFFKECSKQGIDVFYFILSCYKQVDFNYYGFINKFTKSVVRVYNFFEESCKNELDLSPFFFKIKRIKVCLSKLLKTCYRYGLDMSKFFEGIVKNHKKDFSKDQIDFAKVVFNCFQLLSPTFNRSWLLDKS